MRDPRLVVSAWLRGLRPSSTLSSQHAAPTAPKEVWYEGGLLPKEVCFATPGRADLSRLPDVRPEVELSHKGPKGVGACPASWGCLCQTETDLARALFLLLGLLPEPLLFS